MRILITESQYKMLLESNFESIQSLIDMAFDDVKGHCEGGHYIKSHRNYICDPVEVIEEIKVVDVSRGQSTDYFEKNRMDTLNVTVDCYIDSIQQYYNLDNFIYELQEETRNVLGGVNVIITKRETINKRKNFDW